jgi:hypothetical protein
LTRSYRFISEHRAAFGVTRLCRVLGVRRPRFYEWPAAAPARAGQAAVDECLADEITEAHTRSSGTRCPTTCAPSWSVTPATSPSDAA